MPIAERAEGRGLDPEGRALGQERPHLGAEALRAADGGPEPLRPPAMAGALILRIAVEEVLDEPVLVAAGQQLGRLGVCRDTRRSHDLEGERGDRARRRS